MIVEQLLTAGGRLFDRTRAEVEGRGQDVQRRRWGPATPAIVIDGVRGRLLRLRVLQSEVVQDSPDGEPCAAQRSVVPYRLEDRNCRGCNLEQLDGDGCVGEHQQVRAFDAGSHLNASVAGIQRRLERLVEHSLELVLLTDVTSGYAELAKQLAASRVLGGKQCYRSPQKIDGGGRVGSLPRTSACATEPLTGGSCKPTCAVVDPRYLGPIAVRLLG